MGNGNIPNIFPYSDDAHLDIQCLRTNCCHPIGFGEMGILFSLSKGCRSTMFRDKMLWTLGIYPWFFFLWYSTENVPGDGVVWGWGASRRPQIPGADPWGGVQDHHDQTS